MQGDMLSRIVRNLREARVIRKKKDTDMCLSLTAFSEFILQERDQLMLIDETAAALYYASQPGRKKKTTLMKRVSGE